MGLPPMPPMPPGAGAPPGPGGGPMPAGNQVQITFNPSPNGSISMSIDSPEGAVDIDISLETAMGMLMDLTKVLGAVSGVDVSEAFAGLGAEAGGMQAGPSPDGGMQAGPMGGPPLGGPPLGGSGLG